MAAFAPVLDRTQASAIRDYVRHRAQQDGVGAEQASAQPPDAQRGAAIVAKGTSSGAVACVSCHGVNGASDGGVFPRVGGQPALYLSDQLQDFKSKARANAIMAPIAQGLSADDIRDVSAHYANADTSSYAPLGGGNAQLVEKGKALAESGDAAKGIPACNACHGSAGIGEAPTIPYLAGQYASYTASQLQMWRQGERRNSLDAMRLFATKLSDADIEAVAAYYQQARTSSGSASTTGAPDKH
jgi:cytochrome c553